MRLLFGLILFFFSSACIRIDPGTIGKLENVVNALSKDSASVCGQIQIGGGAGAIAITGPLPSIPAGGYGYSSFIICRTNQKGTVISVDSKGVTIKHGVYRVEDLDELEDMDELEDDDL